MKTKIVVSILLVLSTASVIAGFKSHEAFTWVSLTKDFEYLPILSAGIFFAFFFLMVAYVITYISELKKAHSIELSIRDDRIFKTTQRLRSYKGHYATTKEKVDLYQSKKYLFYKFNLIIESKMKEQLAKLNNPESKKTNPFNWIEAQQDLFRLKRVKQLIIE